MQAVILAAGVSSRLKPLTDNSPKCLLPIGKKNMLHRMIENILWNGIHEIIIVTGYLHYMIEEYVSKTFPDINVKFINNADYQNNNNCYSLWMVKDYVKGKIILMDSDILFEKEIIKRLIDSSHECCLAVNCHQCGEEEIKIVVDSQYRIKEISKTIHPRSALGESIGIEYFSADGMKKMFDTLHKRVITENRVNEWYEASFQEWINNGGELYAVDISDYLAMEIDFPEDIETAEKTILPVLDKN